MAKTRTTGQSTKARAQALTTILREVTTKIEVNGVQLTVKQTTTGLGTYVNVKKVIGRDRKRKIDITGGIETHLDKGDEANGLIALLKRVAGWKTARCSCDYQYGWSDHAEHCQSIYKASDPTPCAFDDD